MKNLPVKKNRWTSQEEIWVKEEIWVIYEATVLKKNPDGVIYEVECRVKRTGISHTVAGIFWWKKAACDNKQTGLLQ